MSFIFREMSYSDFDKVLLDISMIDESNKKKRISNRFEEFRNGYKPEWVVNIDRNVYLFISPTLSSLENIISFIFFIDGVFYELYMHGYKIGDIAAKSVIHFDRDCVNFDKRKYFEEIMQSVFDSLRKNVNRSCPINNFSIKW